MRLLFTLRNSLLAFVLSMSPALAAGTINSLPAITASPGTFPLPDPGCTSTATSNYWITQGTGANTDFRIDPLRAGYIFQGTVAPTCPFKYQLWWNSSTNPPQLQAYSGSAWGTVAYFDTTNTIWTPFIGGGTPTTIASSSTTDLCTISSPQALVTISGSSTINSFGSSCPTGVVKFLTFLSTPQVTYGASTIVLPGAANLTPSAGDVWAVAYLGSGKWQLYNIQNSISVAGVTSFNGRTGVVVPVSGDYSFSLISGTATNTQLPTMAPVGTATNVAGSLASPNTSVVASADAITVGTSLSGTTYVLGSYSQTFNSGTTGAGGMDTGVLPTSGTVCLYAIYNPVSVLTSVLGVNCATSSGTIYSGSHTPTGYTASALLGFFTTNSSPAMVGSLQRPSDRGCAPNVQVLTTGSGATYTTPTCNGVLPLSLEVWAIGGGGGGGGGASDGTTGTAGTATTFSTLTANGGAAGAKGGSSPGAGGTATGGDVNMTGNRGASGTSSISGSSNAPGGIGGSSVLGGAGTGAYTAGTGVNAVVNSGSGGGGGGMGSGATDLSGNGGAAGGYVKKLVTAPISATYTYTVGAAGGGGNAGTGGSGGGNGGTGIISVMATWH